MDGRDWSKFLLPYEQAVEELKVKFKTLRNELKSREEYSPIEFVTGRVKRISSILEKAKRLNVPADQLETYNKTSNEANSWMSDRDLKVGFLETSESLSSAQNL
jgi:ppGpp synthetase/RelA/SpoT-type nucleotidyltranferase